MIPRVKILNNSINDEKLDVTAGNSVQLKAGEKFEVKDSDGFTLLSVDNDTKKVKAKGNIERV